MELNRETKVYNALEAYPFLLEWLVDLHPHFVKLRNPLLRNTMARVATLETAASMAGMSVDALLTKMRAAVAAHSTGDDNKTAASTTIPEDEKVTKLKAIIRSLHDGADFNTVKSEFSQLVSDVSPHEIAAMEAQLMRDGMPEGEIKRLCDVHIAMFRESLDQLQKPEAQPGHPVHTFIQENYALQKVIGNIQRLLDGVRAEQEFSTDNWHALSGELDRLCEVEKHYLRKEYQLFPFLEEKGFTGPSQVMWSIHDDIRAQIKLAKSAVAERDVQAIVRIFDDLLRQIEDMFYKEEHILLPVSLEMLTEDEWARIREGGREFGYALFQPVDLWQPHADAPTTKPQPMPSALPLETGLLSLDQINLMLMHLPIELSFVDEEDTVRYYTQKKEKIFPRSPGVIGRKVQNCHPPKSLDKVNEILARFKDGSRDSAEFWIQLHGRFLHIRYFAVRDARGNYRGTLETVQDVTSIRSLEGERRLLEWN